MKEILRANRHGAAEVLKSELQAQGIDAVIRGDLTLGMGRWWSVGLGSA